MWKTRIALVVSLSITMLLGKGIVSTILDWRSINQARAEAFERRNMEAAQEQEQVAAFVESVAGRSAEVRERLDENSWTNFSYEDVRDLPGVPVQIDSLDEQLVEGFDLNAHQVARIENGIDQLNAAIKKIELDSATFETDGEGVTTITITTTPGKVESLMGSLEEKIASAGVPAERAKPLRIIIENSFFFPRLASRSTSIVVSSATGSRAVLYTVNNLDGSTHASMSYNIDHPTSNRDRRRYNRNGIGERFGHLLEKVPNWKPVEPTTE